MRDIINLIEYVIKVSCHLIIVLHNYFMELVLFNMLHDEPSTDLVKQIISFL